MKKSFTSTLILALVLAGLVAWYLVYEKRMRPEQQKAEDALKQIITLKLADIHELTLERKDAPANEKVITMKQVGSDWTVTQPVADMADGPTMATLLGTVSSTKSERVVDDKPKDLGVYGLKDPAIKVTVRKDASSPAQTISIGDNTPVGPSVYAKTNKDDTVYKMPASLKTVFTKTLKDIRNKAIINIPRFEIGEVEVVRGKDSFVLKRGEKDDWTLARDNMPANTPEVNKLLNAAVELRAKEFVSEDGTNLNSFGLNPPAVKVWLTRTKDKARVALWVGKAKDKVYAKREDGKVIYEVEKDVLEKLQRDSSAYRSMDLAIFNRFDIKRVKLERGKDLIELLKEDAGWTMPSEPKFKVDANKVNDLLAQLQDTKIEKYLPAKPAKSFANPTLVIHLYEGDKGDKEKVALKFDKKEGKSIPVQRAGLDYPYLIKESDFGRIDLAKHSFEKAPDKAAPEKKDSSSALPPG